MKTLRALASLRLTPPGMLLLAAGVLVRYFDATAPELWVVLPLLLLALNLLAALRVNPRFRRQPALLMFHVCLLLLVVLIGAGQLTAMQGRLEIVEGQDFTPDAVTVLQAGRWHPHRRLGAVGFTQGPVRVEYNPGLKRVRTESRLWLPGDRQGGSVAVIGDNTPLQAAGYRFYTTANKGLAAILTWTDGAGAARTGAVHFPSYPVNDWRQLNDWTGPAGERLDLELVFTRRPDFGRAWTLAADRIGAALGVTVDGARRVLQPGQSLRIGAATLRFEGVRLWMGYTIRYEPLLPWLFATAVTGVLALGWHFRTRLATRLPAGAPAPRRAREVKGNAVARF